MSSLHDSLRLEVERRSRILADLDRSIPDIAAFVTAVVSVVKAGGTVFLVGNGGSAAECQHFAAEFTIRYRKNRRPLPAIALTTDSSALTACGNDFSFQDLFARQIEALGKPGDCLLALSTSGRSENLIRAAAVAQERGLAVFGLLGNDGGGLLPLCESAFVVPANDTAVIQEIHLACIHFVCEEIDRWATGSEP
jgi:D-sedoheptulose 7-phosphate isomerase